MNHIYNDLIREGSPVKQMYIDLIRIVAEQMELAPGSTDFRQTMRDVLNGGEDAGWSGFTYSSDMHALLKQHGSTFLKTINELIRDGHLPEVGSLEQFIRGFKGLRNHEPKDDWSVAIRSAFRADIASEKFYDPAIGDHICWLMLGMAALLYGDLGRTFWDGDDT
jgi:hypothetical protein